ncbi:hypothetical protein N7474_000794 [Penicillium riverlandense]|uniref:uncharacterized protein n=1 Tax=Penicillium riverlandense TaxID=1903569 RepID=UPI00254838F0|nr:uncharacterized protein N7474_000794 [Penicillium riverlandense]KAJ5832483.1 hypothetical protein N7474_000794 [Penicillium riverlandense]
MVGLKGTNHVTARLFGTRGMEQPGTTTSSQSNSPSVLSDSNKERPLAGVVLCCTSIPVEQRVVIPIDIPEA